MFCQITRRKKKSHNTLKKYKNITKLSVVPIVYTTIFIIFKSFYFIRIYLILFLVVNTHRLGLVKFVERQMTRLKYK